ncbi:dynactin subunit 6, putative [Plasmodium vivax]|uniref:Dynactin subunit 6 n=1 Tax=Plasmodium vivax TaxID=5855 RepID=A0A1G4H939_PLAVI|nr:unnamed protein product [Plasmodium vivax]SCO71326.1 dynactin subunit 6, putative [Plasmodium vivax]
MSNDKLVKLFSLNLSTSGVGKKERPSPMGGSAHSSSISHTSSGVENQSNSFLPFGSAKTSTNDSCTSIKSEQLNPYKRVSSLSEYVYRFKKLISEGGAPRGGSNTFRQFNPNWRKTSSSDLCSLSSAQSGGHSSSLFCGANLAATSRVTSQNTSRTSRADSNSHLEPKSIPSGTRANKEAQTLPHQAEGYSRPNNDSPFADEEDATVSSRLHLLRNYKMFKSHMSVESSPLCSYLNTIGRLETKARNVGKDTLSRVGGTFQRRNPPSGKTGREMTNPENDVEGGEPARGAIPTTCSIDEKEANEANEENGFSKIALAHNRVLARHKRNTKKKVKKIFYKNRKMCVTIQMSKHKRKTFWRELTNSENKTLIKNLRQNENLVYNKKNRKRLFEFFRDFVISSYFVRNTNWGEERGRPFSRHVDEHILQLALVGGFYRGVVSGFYRGVVSGFNRGPTNGRATKGEPLPPFTRPHKREAPKKRRKQNGDANNEVVRESATKPSYLLATPGSNVTVGTGNILFPGCHISSQKGKIYIGHNNLFEDNITIINCANADMYIGSYNIFRSGTFIANVPTIGDHNYFDYKCSISNGTVGCRSYIRANLFGEKKKDGSLQPLMHRNIVKDMSPAFVNENVHEIKLRYDHMSSSA